MNPFYSGEGGATDKWRLMSDYYKILEGRWAIHLAIVPFRQKSRYWFEEVPLPWDQAINILPNLNRQKTGKPSTSTTTTTCKNTSLWRSSATPTTSFFFFLEEVWGISFFLNQETKEDESYSDWLITFRTGVKAIKMRLSANLINFWRWGWLLGNRKIAIFFKYTISFIT